MKIDDLGNKFRTKVKIWSKKIKVFPYDVKLERMDKKWGYCTSDGAVYFNSELLFLDKDVQDFVIVHELLHLKISNHGKLFKSLMVTYLPEYKDIEMKLMKYTLSNSRSREQMTSL